MVTPDSYTPAALGTKALARLGARLGRREPIDDGEEDLYRRFIEDADQRRRIAQELLDLALQAASKQLPRVGVNCAGRVKTRSTLADKLERTPAEKLPSIRDVAGVRVVADCTLLEQTILARGLAEAFSPRGHPAFTREALVIYRTTQPSAGYRAVHVVIWLSGRPVEIQVRTELQHMWAQLMELLCDRWGREPRYGLPVVEPIDTVREIKQSIVEMMLIASEQIAQFEDATSELGMNHIASEEISPDVKVHLQAAEVALREHIVEFRARVHARLAQVRDLISALDAAIEEADK